MAYARINANGVVVDVVTSDPAEKFVPQIAERFTEVPDDTQEGMHRQDDGTFAFPPEPDDPAPEPEPDPEVSKVDFLKRFTQSERIKLRNAQASDDVINDFMQMLSISEVVMLNDDATIQAVQYCAQNGFIDQSRVPDILGPFAPSSSSGTSG